MHKIKLAAEIVILSYVAVQATRGWIEFGAEAVDYVKDRRKNKK